MTDVWHLFKKVGIIKPDNTFFAFREEKKHFFRKFNGYGLSLAVIKQLRDKYVIECVFVIEKPDGLQKKYYVGLNKFLSNGVFYTDKQGDHQKILGMKYFEEIKDGVQEMNKEKLVELKNAVEKQFEYTELIKENQARFEKEHNDFFESQQVIRDKISSFSKVIAECKEVLTVDAKLGFEQDKIKKRLGGIGIRVGKELLYDNDLALAWCKEKDLFLSVDTKAFDKVAITGTMDFVTIKDKVTVTFPKQIILEEEVKENE